MGGLLTDLISGETVRVKLLGKERWTKGTYAEALDHRSYFVKVGDTQHRRNRRQLLKTSEPSTSEQGEDINPTSPASEENNPEKEDSLTTELRRSGRTRQAPVWHMEVDDFKSGIVQSFYGKKLVNLQKIAKEGFSTVLDSALYP